MQKHMDFADLHLFLRVAELGSLSGVARERDVPVSQISRAITRLEAQHKTRLLHRSTHGLSLTDEGQTMVDYGKRISTSPPRPTSFTHLPGPSVNLELA